MDDRARLEAAKHASTLQLLLQAARRVDEEAIRRVNAEAGQVVARRSTLALVPHIDLEGTRVSTLAARLGISKQAVSQRVAELVAAGVLSLEPDPDDQRAKRVRFTPRGLAAIHEGLGVLTALETELAAEVGADAVTSLRTGLLALLAAVARRQRDTA